VLAENVKSKITGHEYEAKLDEEGESIILGRGAFGVVTLAKNITTGKSVAIKCIVSEGKKEIQLMWGIPEHDNVVQLLDYWTVFSSFYLVMDLADGDLYNFVEELVAENDQDESLQNTTDLRKYSNMLIHGVKHLHDNGIIHRDLKPGNVVRFENDNGDQILKISDFGISKKLVGTLHAGTTDAGTDKYMAPEVSIAEGKYTKDVDKWSLGLVLYFLVTGRDR
jgi:calcium/calmodulin-dependent protein kinase I